MKHFVLVYIVRPVDLDDSRPSNYGTTLAQLESLVLKGAKSLRLHENCWLLERESDVLALSTIVCASEKHRLDYTVRFLSEE